MAIRFWIDGREYTAPDPWLKLRIRARRTLGANIQNAAVEAMLAWAKEHGD